MRSIELLRKYLASDLTNEERFELEKLALDDDFLASAWEGLSGGDIEASRNAMARLEKRLSSKKKGGTKIIPLYRKLWPYAAAASVALGFFYLRPVTNEAAQMDQQVAITEVGSESDLNTSIATIVADEVVMPAVEQIKSDLDKTEPMAEDQKTTPLKANKSARSLNKTDTQSRQSRQPKEDKNDPPITKNQVSTVSSIRSYDHTEIPNKVLESEDDIPNTLTKDALATMPEAVPIPDVGITNIDVESSKLKSGIEPSVVIINSDNNPGFIAYKKISEADSNVNDSISITYDDGPIIVEEAVFDAVIPSSDDQMTPIAEPVVGQKTYKEVLRAKTTVTREDLFMLGIDMHTVVIIKFTVDEKGIPDQIKFENLPLGLITEKLEKLLKSAGPWKDANQDWHTYSFTMPIKS